MLSVFRSGRVTMADLLAIWSNGTASSILKERTRWKRRAFILRTECDDKVKRPSRLTR